MNPRYAVVKCGLVVLGLMFLTILFKGVFDVCYYSVLEEQRAILKRAGERIDEKIDTSQIFFQSAVNGQDFLGMSEERRVHKCREILAYGFASVQIFDESTRLVYKLENQESKLDILIKPDIYKEMIDGKFVMYGKVSESNPADSVVIMMLAQLDADMNYAGAVAAYINGRDFARLMNSETLKIRGSYLVLNDEDNFMVFNDRRYVSDNARLIYERSRRDWTQPREPDAFLQQYFLQAEEYVYIDLPIVNAPWHLIAVIPSDEFLKFVLVQMLNKGMALLIIMSVIGLIIWSIMQRNEFFREKEHMKVEKMKMVMQMSASMAHEIKNPLTSLKGFLQYLYYKQKKEHPEQEKFFAIMFDEVDRIEMLANQFCMMAKPDENIKKELVDVNRVMEEIYLLCDAQAKKRGIRLEYEPLPESAAIWGNRQQLKQIFINLLNNAFDAVAAGEGSDKRVQLLSQLRGISCQLEVRDNGIGIRPEDMHKLCTAFYTTKEQGNGLGLMITNELIKQHKGTMQIKSEYGKGTSFIITMPLHNTQAANN